jgi:hypothetical protein
VHHTILKAHNMIQMHPSLCLTAAVAVLASQSCYEALFPGLKPTELFTAAHEFVSHIDQYTEPLQHVIESPLNHLHNGGTAGLNQASHNAQPIFIESHITFSNTMESQKAVPIEVSSLSSASSDNIWLVLGCLVGGIGGGCIMALSCIKG